MVKRLASVLFIATVSINAALALERVTERPCPLGDTELINFEGQSVPSDWSAQKSSIEVSSLRFKHGKQSLQWNWEAGATLTLHRKLDYLPEWPARVVHTNRGDVTELSYPTAFSMWIYNETPLKDKLTFEFGRAAKTDCTFDFYLDFTGWRHAMVHYERGYMAGKPHVDMDTLRIKAPQNGKGRFFIDGVITSCEMNPKTLNPTRQLPHIHYHPRRASLHWHRLEEWSQQRSFLPVAERMTEMEIETIKLMNQRYEEIVASNLNQTLSESSFLGIKHDFEAMGLKRGANGIVTGTAVFNVHYRELLQRVPNDQMSNYHTLRSFCSVMKRVATAYAQAQNQQKTELANMGIMMLDHLNEQGYAEGGMPGWIHHYGYNTRDIAPSVYLLRDELEKRGKLIRVLCDMRYLFGMGEIYDESQTYGNKNVPGSDADALNTIWFARLGILLSMPDSPEKTRDLKCYSRFFGNIALAHAPGLTDCFKADGSTYHHSGPHPGYGVGALGGVAKIFKVLNHTMFAPPEKGYLNFKRCLTAHQQRLNNNYGAIACSQIKLNLSRKLEVSELFAFVAASTDIHGCKHYDEDMAEQYLACIEFKGEETDLAKELRSAGFKPADNQVHRTLSYSSLAIHRNEDALLIVKGHSRYVYPYECWGRGGMTMSNVNAFGYTELIYPEKTGDTRVNNGFEEAGWDWNKWPGTTTVEMPWDNMETVVYKIGDEGAAHLFSDQRFCGGVDMDQSGIFAASFHGHDQMLLESFYANKSWFFVEDLVVCLGSGITDSITKYPTITTVMQQPMAKRDEIAIMNGQKMTAFPIREEIGVANPYWMIDSRQTGYLVMPGTRLNVTRRTQTTPNRNNTDFLSGDYMTAWIDHGTAPQNATYAYAMKLKTNQKEMKQAAQVLPFKILSCQEDRHIVSFPQKRTMGYVFFKRQNEVQHGPVKAVDTPCVMMIKESGNKMRISAVDPDLHIYDGASEDTGPNGSRRLITNYMKQWYTRKSEPSQVRAIVKGSWELLDNQTHVSVSPYQRDTLLKFTSRDGLCIDVTLVAK